MAFKYGKVGKAAAASDKVRRRTVDKSPASASRTGKPTINRNAQSQLEALGYAPRSKSRAPKTGR